MAFSFGPSAGIAFLVAAGITYEIIAKDVSSPQTAEINIRSRAGTLMKWVHIGQVESAFFIAAAAYADKEHRMPILAGGILAMVITEAEYIHAKRSGLKNPGPPTEQTQGTQGTPGVIDQAAVGGATAALVSSAI
jgi:hypothetical protein